MIFYAQCRTHKLPASRPWDGTLFRSRVPQPGCWITDLRHKLTRGSTLGG